MNCRHHYFLLLGFGCFALISLTLIISEKPSSFSPVPTVYAEESTSQEHPERPSSRTTTKQDIADDRITFAVENALYLDSGITPRLIDIDTNTGIVTLSGSVTNILSKERAILAAETIKGVRGVIDQIIVMPSGVFTDQHIQRDVNEALSKNPAIDQSSLHVAVTDGEVTVDGQVNSWPSRQLALEVVKGVKGVKKVVSNMKVVENDNRSDSEIEAEIKQRLGLDVWLNEWLIAVQVQDGHVTLNGTVSSAAEKTRAMKMAWTAGVQEVDGSGIQVEWWARQGNRRAKPLVVRNKKDVEQTILESWKVDPRIEIAHPAVTFKNGTAILRGTVSTLQAKSAAEQNAKNTIGVFRTKNFLKVRPTEHRTDHEIAEDIRAAIVRDPFLERLGLSVSVFDGVAYLAGSVDNTFQKTHAQIIASQMPGVVKVLNRLRVLSVPQNKDDHEILQDIQDELWWSPFIDSDNINVAVNDGLVTLTGTVHSWREKQIAGENAREGGAIAVKNKLTVN